MPDNSISIEIDASKLQALLKALVEIPEDDQICEDIADHLKTALINSTDWAFKNESNPNTGAKWKERVIDRQYVRNLMKYRTRLAKYEEQKKKAQNSKGKKAKIKMKKPVEPQKPHPKLQLHGMDGGLRDYLEEDDVETGKTYASLGSSLGANLRYARIHQLGGLIEQKNGRTVKIPARPYLGLTKEERMYAFEDIADTLLNAIRNAAKK